MLTVKTFTDSDLQKINSIPSSLKLTAGLILVIIIPLSFLLGLFGLLKKGYGYWTTTLGFLTVFILVGIYVIVKGYFIYRKDKRFQSKYVGTITIVKKSAKKTDRVLFTDSSELKKLELNSSELFDKISIGDILTIEISKFSKTLFKLENDGFDLLNGR